MFKYVPRARPFWLGYFPVIYSNPIRGLQGKNI